MAATSIGSMGKRIGPGGLFNFLGIFGMDEALASRLFGDFGEKMTGE